MRVDALGNLEIGPHPTEAEGEPRERGA
jgi:hypothetical protein